jgi:hypothetical protein
MANNSGGGTLTQKQLQSLLNYIFTVADCVGNTKSEQVEALQQIADLSDPETAVRETSDGEWEVVEDEEEEEEENE